MTSRYPGGLIRKNAANTAVTGASGVWDLGSQAQAVKNNTWPISGLANPVSGSLRFRSSVSAFLSRTPASSSNRRTWTWSGWIKLGSKFSDGFFPIFGADATGYPCSGIALTSFNIQFFSYTHPVYDWQKISTAVFRDPSAWYHIVAVTDTTNGTAEDRARVYVNGQRVTSWSTNNNPSPSYEGYVNSSSYITKVGRFAGFDYFDGCMAEVNFVDGQALEPSSFGQTSAITGVWEPIKYTGTYGTNGFYLSLSDTSSIGKDFSGNGNNLTPNNISTTSGATFDLMRDVPTQYTPQGATDVGGVVRGNYATLNSLDFTTVGTISEGNLKFTQGTSGAKSGRATFGVSSGKWYWEYTHLGGNSSPGIGNASMTLDYYCGGDANGWSYFVGGSKYNNDAATAYGASYTTNDVIGIALDMDAGTLVFYKNGASQGTAFSSLTGTMFPAFSSSSVSNVTFIANFGQRPFAYTPPSGFKSLCTTNLPTPTIGATTATAASKYFNAVIWTGTGGTRSITGVGFQPDFVWAKARSQAYSNIVFDSNRGVGKNLLTDTQYAEATNEANGYISSFDADGFSSNFSAAANYYFNESGTTYVAWNWNAGGSTVTNTAGSITSQVRANPTAGFSIVTWTGTGTNRPSIGHGLGVAPSMIIEKGRDAGTGPYNWTVQHIGLSSWSNSLFLNNTSGENSGSGGGTAPSSTVYYAAVNNYAGENGVRYVAYCFAPVAGYSAFGKYTGNGSSDGPFTYTGFRPRFVMIKRTDSVGNWWMIDIARSTYNQMADVLLADSNGAEFASGTGWPGIDYLSNGFKLRGSAGGINASGSTYIYAAFAETPFKNSLAR